MKHWNWLRVYWLYFPSAVAAILLTPKESPPLIIWAPVIIFWYIAGRRDQQRGTGHTCQYEITSEIFAWGKLRPRTLHCTIKNCRSEQTITYGTASRAITKEEA